MIGSEAEAQNYIAQHWGAQALENCRTFVSALQSENERQNLVSRRSLDEVWVRHVADSAQLLHYAPANCGNWIDIGTGAGFPGLVIALLRPDLQTMLVEPRRLRVEWLQGIRDSFNLINCSVIMTRAEKLPSVNYDVISARAVAGLEDLLQMTERLAGAGTRWIFSKGRNAEEELRHLPKRLTRHRVFHVKHSLTASDARIMVCELAKDQG